ncbi:MAG: alkane 1-monooxygenase [Deltaproteobacteria bacterium]|nr:alkane 1-monooxygenase [Deltaproteobacteria bacterium]
MPVSTPIATLPSPEARLHGAPLWLLHLLAFVVPVATLLYGLTGPHDWKTAFLFFSVIPLSVMVDNRAGPSLSQPDATLAERPFTMMVVLLALLQFANIGLLALHAADDLAAWPTAALTVLLYGVNSGYSAIVVAHELIHRSTRGLFTLGRALLCTVFYEHFSVEHVRGHHARVGTPEDPATARYGETFNRFFLRTVPAQFRSAWLLEHKRLGGGLLRNCVLHGVIVEVALVAGLGLAFGWPATALFLAQAFTAVLLLEGVNYFEHWGLLRTGKKVAVVDSWDTDNWFTRFTLIGLSRHADHHAHASRPFQQLRHFAESPKLPRGYFGMVLVGIFQNRRYLAEMTERLAARGITGR